MTNDRMYIRCKGCGELHYLAKCYDDGYFTTHEGEELRRGLDDFFDRHKWCYDKYYGGFELVYESDEDAESDDERIRKQLIEYHKQQFENNRDQEVGLFHKDALAWLEKQKEQKPVSISCGHENDAEWSEDDEKMLDSIIRVVCGVGVQPNGLREKQVSWLKALRPDSYKNCNSRWKPSEEQMEALHTAMYLEEMQFYGGLKDKLRDLYVQLKKL